MLWSCCSQSTAKGIAGFDEDGDGMISKDQMMRFIEQDAKLWAMLSVNTNIPESRCRKIARDVAYEMSKQPRNVSLKDMTMMDKGRQPTVKEFSKFVAKVRSPQGHQEFFHRTVFAAFDDDKSGYLEPPELEKFLDIFYEADSIFAGDSRLPDKNVFKSNVLRGLDRNGDGRIEFEELRCLISGDLGVLEKVLLAI